MKQHFIFQIVIVLSILISCSESKEYIVETDIKNFVPDTIGRLTQAEIQDRFSLFIDEVKHNTIGKLIPETAIYNTDGEGMKLNDIITGETIIAASDASCGWGGGLLTMDFPNALRKLEKEIQNTRVVCLAIRVESDLDSPENLNNFIKELKSYYHDVYIIDEEEAMKLNLVCNTTRLYINKDLLVKNMGIGMFIGNDYLIKEIRANNSLS